MEKFKKFLPVILIIILIMPVILPLAHRGFFPMHDDTQPTRVYEMAKALKDGQFPVRWVADLGYGFGYPIFNFYSPLPYYAGASAVLIGVDVLVATKLMFAIPIFLGALGMYFLVRKLWGSAGGVIAALAYTYAPYHAVEIYVRGAVGEYWAWSFLPWVLLGIIFTTRGQTKKGLIIGSLSFAALILSHNITALICSYFLFLGGIGLLLYSWWDKETTGRALQMGKLFIFGFGLAAFFWLPALFEAGYTNVVSLAQGTNDYHQHFVFIDQLWDSPWGFAGSAVGRDDGLSFKVGKTHLFVALLAIVLLLSISRKDKKSFSSGIFLSFSGLLISIFMMLSVSAIVWEHVPQIAFIQYPWRFLLFTNFFLAIIIGSLGNVKITNKYIYYCILGIAALALILPNYKYFSPQYLTPAVSSDYTDEQTIRTRISSISDEYLPRHFPIPQNQQLLTSEKIIKSNDIIVGSSDIKTHWWKSQLSVQEDTELTIAQAFFPGWTFVVDEKIVKPLIKDGLPTITLLAGEHLVTAYLADTPVRIIGNAISVVSILVLLIILLPEERTHEEKYT